MARAPAPLEDRRVRDADRVESAFLAHEFATELNALLAKYEGNLCLEWTYGQCALQLRSTKIQKGYAVTLATVRKRGQISWYQHKG